MQISVVIPTYNRAHTVCRAIDSVLGQTLPPCEIVVIDDGSTDDTASKLKARYGNTIALHCSNSNSGVSSARNYAIEQSNGDWIAFLDSDDQWMPHKLERQVRQLQQSPHILCHTDEIWIRNGVRVNPMKKHAKQGGYIFDRCTEMCVISPSSVLVDKAALNDAGNFDESLPACEDYDLWLKLTAHAPVLYVDDPLLIKYGGHTDQLSRKYWGMDRFRIQSLNTLLTAGNLSHAQSEQVKAILKRKLTILRKGAVKHRNMQVTSYCDTILASVCANDLPGDLME